MTVILYLLLVSLAIAACGLAFFLWSLRSGQYDDLDGAANRILFDDPGDAPPPPQPIPAPRQAAPERPARAH